MVSEQVRAIQSLRTRLTQARVSCRMWTREEKRARALTEQRAYNLGVVTGSNQAQRENQLACYLIDDSNYQDTAHALCAAQDYVAALETEYDNLLEERLDRELVVREKLADAMLAQAGAPLLLNDDGIRVPADVQEG